MPGIPHKGRQKSCRPTLLTSVQEVLYFDTGEISYKSPVKDGMPWGWGYRYFKNGSIHLRGIFQDWFIVWGWEYYKNGNLRYVGHYNEGPRHYYGPRYFAKGELYYETGELGFGGSLTAAAMATLGIPCLRPPRPLTREPEYAKSGKVLRGYLNHGG